MIKISKYGKSYGILYGILDGLLVMLVISIIPIAIAEGAKASADAQAITTNKLKFRKFGEAINDFFFKVKLTFAFDNDARLELLKNRNEELKERQQLWIGTKANALAQFNAANLSQEDKKSLLEEIQEEHTSIIQAHLQLTSEIREIQAQARAKGEAVLEQEANAASELMLDSKLGLGLDIAEAGGNGMLGIIRKLELNGKAGEEAGTAITSQDALEIARSEFGIVGSAREESKNGVKFFVVSGQENRSNPKFELERNIDVWIEASTGAIASVDLEAHVENKGAEAGNAKSGLKPTGETKAKANALADISIGRDMKTEEEAESELKIEIG
ncbi:hypothetical protein HYU10_00015 [Candidatus Woesearchaeota archaeon]|nr:hypothetical protein [Candidatus Woesearchaeota archaeon]